MVRRTPFLLRKCRCPPMKRAAADAPAHGHFAKAMKVLMKKPVGAPAGAPAVASGGVPVAAHGGVPLLDKKGLPVMDDVFAKMREDFASLSFNAFTSRAFDNANRRGQKAGLSADTVKEFRSAQYAKASDLFEKMTNGEAA